MSDANTKSRIFRILSAPTRVRVLQQLNGKRTVIEIANATQLPYSYISRILFGLYDQGFLKVKTSGTHRYYSIDNPTLKSLLKSMPTEQPLERHDEANTGG